jgi:GTPase SAR1 family protein
MSTKQTHRRIPNIHFRVLVIGRANAGKTSILQRVCDTTESPTIYRQRKYGRMEEVRDPNCVCESNLIADQVKLDPSMDVSDNRTSLRSPLKHDGTSEASISLTMNFCSPIIRVTFFTTLAESSRVT